MACLRFCGATQDADQLSIFSTLAGQRFGPSDLSGVSPKQGWDEREKLRREKEALGFYITGHPLDRFKPRSSRFSTCTIQDLLGPDRQDRGQGGGRH